MIGQNQCFKMQTFCNCNFIFVHQGGLGQETAKDFSVFESSSPVYYKRWKLRNLSFIAEHRAGKLSMPFFIVFGLDL